jgi:hypothetical protein
MYYMKVIMDADCLIKLTKAGLKEHVCRVFSLFIPRRVKEEVVDKGKEKELPDAVMIDENIALGRIKVLAVQGSKKAAGEQEAVALFQTGGFDAIGSDDKQFIRQLKLFGIPYLTPATCIAIMHRQGILKTIDALKSLEELAAHISESEYHTVKLYIEKRRPK